MSLGALAFLNPMLLGALLALPIIYWLLRTVPPRPRRIAFPATRILVGLENREKTPAKTPWWLTLIRMLAAALVILALAEPVINPPDERALRGTGPVVIVVDNGWSAANRFNERLALVDRLIADAETQQRPVLIAQTAPPAKTQTLRIDAPINARTAVGAIVPQPFEPQRLEVAAQLEAVLAGTPAATIYWLTDGIDHAKGSGPFAQRLSALAGSGGSLSLVDPRLGEEALALAAGLGREGRLEVTVLRAGGGVRSGYVLALSARGQRLGEAAFTFGASDRSAQAHFTLPLELRNQVTRVEIAGERSAGAVHLLDASSRWNRIGIVSGESREQAQPLLAPLYYIDRALAPFSELVRPKDANLVAAVSDAFKQNVSVLIAADVGTLSGELHGRVEDWVKKGGVLVRFSGPRLEKGGDSLLPVALRIGGRTLGGALSWSTPQPLAAFDDTSAFAGLAIPPDVLVNRQVLADPGAIGDSVKVWARLRDGTPLVTSARRGEGQVVLFHVTANSDWSNLPLSGLFVDMLRRIAAQGRPGGVGVGGIETSAPAEAIASAEVLAPLQLLDGNGVLRPPTPTAQAISVARLDAIRPSFDHPPGYYGPQATPRALNVATQKTLLEPLSGLPFGVERRAYEGQTTRAMKPDLLTAALILLFIDIVAVLLLQAGPFWRRRAATGTAALLLALVSTNGVEIPTAAAQVTRSDRPVTARTREEQTAIQATGKVTLAYVLTGDATADDASRLGLTGLGRVLAARTAVEPGEPFGVNVVTDEIAFFPLIYWPVLANARALPDATLAKIDAYMKQGGMIIFDTRDYGQGAPSGFSLNADGATALQRMLGRLDIPRLEPVPETHVLTKAFYLLRAFPGRWDGGQLWVEAESSEDPGGVRKARRVDGVSSLLVTSNDFAAAWALDERNRPVYPTVPGGDAQREQAFRVGINIVMYALTGNYKADQVHVPALLERLGQ
jgi:Domain of unknown function (DUF4159)/Aerotolerance regulator N-terminal